MPEYTGTLIMGLADFEQMGEDRAKRQSEKLARASYARRGGTEIRYIDSTIFYPVTHADEVHVATRLEAEII